MNPKKIVVTGASRGIGLELVKQLHAQGHELLAISRNVSVDAASLLAKKGVTFLEADIVTQDGLDIVVAYVAAHWKQVDVIVHNAGALLHKPFKETTTNDFLHIYSVNVFAVAALTRALDPYLTPGSHVVGISSMGGIQGSMKFPGLAAYSSSKGALITLMELLAEEYKERGVFFNALALGAVQTEMLKEAFPDYEAPTTAEEMARYISDFAINGSSVFNGKVLQVSNSTP